MARNVNHIERFGRLVASPGKRRLIPAHTRGKARKRNPTWNALRSRRAYHQKVGHHKLAEQLRKQMQQLPSRDPLDPEYRRLRYVRYADDFVLGFIGPKAEAKRIKESLETFLRDTLKLELSREKTLITHAVSQAAKFLGYELVNQQAHDQLDSNGNRNVNGRIGLRVPAKVIEQHCHAYMSNGKPASNSSGHAPRPWLPLFTSDDLKDNRYPGAGWSPAIRSNTCRNTSRDTATSAS